MGSRWTGTVGRWLAGGHKRPPRHLRFVMFALGLLALGGIYQATKSEGLQVLALFALTFGVLPALSRRYGVRDEYTEMAVDVNAPARVLAWSLVFIVPWGALTFFLVPESFGPWFSWWLVMWPALEVYAFLAEQALQHDEAQSWSKTRPVRDSALAGAATSPVIFFILTVTGDASVGEAILTGVLCGFIVFGITAASESLRRSAADSDSHRQA